MEQRDIPRAPALRGVSHRRKHVQRRRWLLWFPIMLVGLYFLATQLVDFSPNYLLIGLGILLCIPWVADTP